MSEFTDEGSTAKKRQRGHYDQQRKTVVSLSASLPVFAFGGCSDRGVPPPRLGITSLQLCHPAPTEVSVCLGGLTSANGYSRVVTENILPGISAAVTGQQPKENRATDLICTVEGPFGSFEQSTAPLQIADINIVGHLMVHLNNLIRSTIKSLHLGWFVL